MDPTSPEYQAMLNAQLGQAHAPTQAELSKFLTPEMVAKLIGPDISMQHDELQHQRALADSLRKPQQAHGPLGVIAATLRGQKANEREHHGDELYKFMLSQDQDQRRAAAEYQQRLDAQNGARQDRLLDIMSARYGLRHVDLAPQTQGAQPGQAAGGQGQGAEPGMDEQLARAAALRQLKDSGVSIPFEDAGGY